MNYIEENINQTNVKLGHWKQYKNCLKHKYKNEYDNKVTTYKLSEKEMEEYLKKFNK